MEKVKNKRILKKIANEWAAGILFATEGSSFDEEMDEILTAEEQEYIIDHVESIARKLASGDIHSNLNVIVKKYSEIE